MTETRTFNNVAVRTDPGSSNIHTDANDGSWILEGWKQQGVFNESQWDMEITFTRKFRPGLYQRERKFAVTPYLTKHILVRFDTAEELKTTLNDTESWVWVSE